MPEPTFTFGAARPTNLRDLADHLASCAGLGQDVRARDGFAQQLSG